MFGIDLIFVFCGRNSFVVDYKLKILMKFDLLLFLFKVIVKVVCDFYV